MKTVLLTGATGRIGSRLLPALTPTHRVIALSRRPFSSAGAEVIAGDFTKRHDLRRLDAYPIDTVVHLAAALEQASEREAMTVNVDGTLELLHYSIGRSVRQFLLASSIAATGCLSSDFIPEALPIDDDAAWGGAADDAYGRSKYLMEQAVFKMGDSMPHHDVTLFRLGVVVADDAPTTDLTTLREERLPFAMLGAVSMSEVVHAFLRRAETQQPGIRRMNLVARRSRTTVPTAEAVAAILRQRHVELDLDSFARPENAWQNAFRTQRLSELLDLDRR